MSESLENITRGDVYYADLNPVIGSEQGGTRPVLVIQNNVGNHFSPTVIIAPITSRMKKMVQPTHIGIPEGFGNLPARSMVMLEQIRTIDKKRLIDYCGHLDEELMDYIDDALGISLGLSDDETDKPDEMQLCLCPVCARQFINSPDHVVTRVDRWQKVRNTCTYCNVRQGYDYRIVRKKKKMGDDRV